MGRALVRVRRAYVQPVEPVAFAPALRAGLRRVHWTRNMADTFRREAIFNAYRPRIAEALAEDHLAIAGQEDRWYSKDGRVGHTYADAFKNTIRQHGELTRAQLSRAFDEGAIRDHADNYARICSRISLERGADFALSMGIDPPGGRNVTDAGAAARLADPQWWRRALRRAWNRRAENIFREIGIVRRGREAYASDDAVKARAGMKSRAKKFLESHEAVNENGEQLSLFKLAEHSLANPALRRGEFMCRVRGFEEIARDAGHVAQFWTLTTPSAFHAQLATGQKNPNFARAVVRDAQAWLCKQWAKVRAKLKRLSILLYGFRIAEPHHDATPHWHLLLFCRSRDSGTIETVIRGYWLAEFADEKGAREYRAKCELIDSTKGSAAGYVAKYVSKNIDGAGAIGEAQDSETGERVADSVRRVDAWASLHGIRQFQQVGGPPVGLWRELRRLTEVSPNSEIERARARADAGDWRGFVYALSFEGIRAGRRVGLQIEREETGELTKYAEPRAPRVVGVRYCSAVEVTRPHSWRIQKCGTIATSLTTEAGSGSACAEQRMFSSVGRSSGGVAGLGLNPLFWDQYGKPKRKGRRTVMRTDAKTRGCDASLAHGRGAGSSSSSFSSLGPVAITVRGPNSSLAMAGKEADPGARPSRAPGEPSWREWEGIVGKFEREHGRFPDVTETRELWRQSG